MKAAHFILILCLSAASSAALADRGIDLVLGSEFRLNSEGEFGAHGVVRFDLLKETQSQSFQIEAEALTRKLAEEGFGLEEGEASLAWSRENEASRIAFDLNASTRLLGSGFGSSLGADSADLLAGPTGKRTEWGVAISADFARTSPLSFSVSLGTSDISFIDADPALLDRTDAHLRLGALLALSETTGVALDFGTRQIDLATPSDTAVRHFSDLNLGWHHATTAASFTAALSAQESRDGTATTAFVLREVETPLGRFDLGGGAILLSDGQVEPQVLVRYETRSRRAEFSLELANRLAISSTGEEQILSRLATTWSLDVTERASLGLRASYGEMNSIDGVRQTRVFAELRADLALTRDWRLETGIRHSVWEDQGTAVTSRNDHLFVGLSRTLEY